MVDVPRLFSCFYPTLLIELAENSLQEVIDLL